MLRYYRLSVYIKEISLILYFLNLYFSNNIESHLIIICIMLFLLTLGNDILRFKIYSEQREISALSIGLSMLFFGTLIWYEDGYATIYNYLLLFEIIVMLGEKGRKKFWILFIINQLCSISLIIYSNIKSLPMRREYAFYIYEYGAPIPYYKMPIVATILNSVYDIIFYYIIVIICYQIVRYQNLSDEYKQINKKLSRYSKRVRDLTIIKERNRLAQDIHDSIGHSLTGLIMHLDFTEKIFEESKEKTKDLIIKSQDLARESLKDLRKAVDTLKEESKEMVLVEAVEDMISNFKFLDRVQIEFNYDEEIESISIDIKDALYRVIQEAVTNSLKHGKAEHIIISLQSIGEELKLTIKDNGKGTDKIEKNNGLMGIEKRIKDLAGQIRYTTCKGKGFLIEVSISS